MRVLFFILIMLFFKASSFSKELTQEERRECARKFLQNRFRDWSSGDSEGLYYTWAIFFDIDADRRQEVLMASGADDSRDGCNWHYVRSSLNNIVKDVYCDVYCRQKNLYVCEALSQPPLLVGREVIHYPEGAAECQVSDVSVALTPTKDKIISYPLKDGFEQLICHPRFRRLSPVALSWFSGEELKEDVIRTFTPLPDNPVMPPPSAALKTLIQNYRQEIKTQYNLTQKFAVYTISLDADNDGDDDVYISSYPERVKGDQLKWHLYMNRKGVYRPATKNMWISDPTSKRHGDFLEVLDPEETASPFAFFRLFHYGVPRIIIFDNKRGRGLTYTYLKLISSEDHARRPPEGIGDADRSSDWHIEMKEKNGCSVPFTVREYLMSGNVVIERIPCRVDVE